MINVASAPRVWQSAQIGVYSPSNWMLGVGDTQWLRSLVKGLIQMQASTDFHKFQRGYVLYLVNNTKSHKKRNLLQLQTQLHNLHTQLITAAYV